VVPKIFIRKKNPNKVSINKNVNAKKIEKYIYFKILKFSLMTKEIKNINIITLIYPRDVLNEILGSNEFREFKFK
jgi:hypothetical protein